MTQFTVDFTYSSVLNPVPEANDVSAPFFEISIMSDNILYQTHPLPYLDRPLIYLLAVIVMTLAFVLDILYFLAACLITILILSLKYFSTTLKVTEDSTTLKQGLLSRTTNNVYHHSVGNIRISQSLIERILNVGTLEIASAGTSGYEIKVSGIPDPKNIRTLIEQQQNHKRI